MFSVKVDVIRAIVEVHLGGSLSESQLSDVVQELRSVFAATPEPPDGVLFERKTARPANQHVVSLLGKVFEVVQASGAQRVADAGPSKLNGVTYAENSRHFETEEEARRWLSQLRL